MRPAEPGFGELIDVGCGDRPFSDGRSWTYFDARDLHHIHVMGRAEELDHYFKEDSAREIRATHILEHFSWRDTVRVLLSWKRVLRQGGRLYVEVPNLSWQTKAHIEGHSDIEIVNLMYGDQDHIDNYHHAAFTQGLLVTRFTEAGFRQVKAEDIGMVLVAEGFK